MKKVSSKIRNIHRKTPVLESLFNKVAGFHEPFNFIKKRLRTPFLKNIYERPLPS